MDLDIAGNIWYTRIVPIPETERRRPGEGQQVLRETSSETWRRESSLVSGGQVAAPNRPLYTQFAASTYNIGDLPPRPQAQGQSGDSHFVCSVQNVSSISAYSVTASLIFPLHKLKYSEVLSLQPVQLGMYLPMILNILMRG